MGGGGGSGFRDFAVTLVGAAARHEWGEAGPQCAGEAPLRSASLAGFALWKNKCGDIRR